MYSSKYKCIAVHVCDGGALTLGKVYNIEHSLTGRSIEFVGNRGVVRWCDYYLKQFELVPPKVKGYIFRTNYERGYYRCFYSGLARDKGDAHVYSMKEAQANALLSEGWGGKAEGNWQVVYE